MPRSAQGLVAIAIASLVLALSATHADAAATRAEYAAQVEPICQSGAQPAAKALLALGKATVKKVGSVGELDDLAGHPNRLFSILAGPYSKWMGRVNAVYRRETNSIAAVAPPPGDEATIAMWVQQRMLVSRFAARGQRSVRHKKVKRFVHSLGQAEKISGRAAKTVAGFGFVYCTKSFVELAFPSG
jgi:hypothetical protein